MENQNNSTEQEKKKGKFDYISIIFAVGCIFLFGPIAGLGGFAVEEVLKRTLAKKNPGKDLYTVISYVAGAVAALALSGVIRMILSSL